MFNVQILQVSRQFLTKQNENEITLFVPITGKEKVIVAIADISPKESFLQITALGMNPFSKSNEFAMYKGFVQLAWNDWTKSWRETGERNTFTSRKNCFISNANQGKAWGIIYDLEDLENLKIIDEKFSFTPASILKICITQGRFWIKMEMKTLVYFFRRFPFSPSFAKLLTADRLRREQKDHILELPLFQKN
jgi:hypothetical protein